MRDQMLNFLASIVVFLLLTNAMSAIVAVFALRLAKTTRPAEDGAGVRRLDAFLRRAA